MAELKVVTIDGLTYYHGKVTALIDKKVDKVEGKGLSTEDFTTELKTKLEGVAEGAQVNVIESVKVNGTALAIEGKAVNVDLSAYATKDDVSAIPKYATLPVDALPTEDISETTIYLVPNDGSGTNARDEYIYVDGKWEMLGTTEVDLSGYYTSAQVDELLAAVEGDVSAVYTKTQVDEIVDGLEQSIGTKANSADVYLKTETMSATEIASAIDADCAVVDGRITTEVATINEALAGKVNTSDLVAMSNAEIDALFA